MAQIWFKGNTAAQKWTEEEVESIFEDTYKWLEDNETVKLKTEIELYMLKNHSVGVDTWRNWINKQYTNNKRIQQLYRAMDLIIENRVVYDKEKALRPNIQALVLQNKHNYRERTESDNRTVVEMPKVKINDNEVEFDIE